MDQLSLCNLDDLREGDLVIVEFRPLMQSVRSIMGIYGGLERAEKGSWYLKIAGKATIRTIDIVSVRTPEQVEA